MKLWNIGAKSLIAVFYELNTSIVHIISRSIKVPPGCLATRDPNANHRGLYRRHKSQPPSASLESWHRRAQS
jgi:hypothetical protein